MHINLGSLFPTRKKTPSKGQVSLALTDVASKASLIDEVKSLPEGGYAILVTMIPDEDGGLLIRDNHHPHNCNQATYHGVYNYAAEYFARRVHGHVGDE